MYGALAWGVLPIQPGVSWETHLAAALIGLVLAIALRHLDIPPRHRYTWEVEADEAAGRMIRRSQFKSGLSPQANNWRVAAGIR